MFTNKCSYGNDNPYRMDYQGCKHLFPILYPIAPESVWGCLSTIGSTYLTLVLLPKGTIYLGTQRNTIRLFMCYKEKDSIGVNRQIFMIQGTDMKTLSEKRTPMPKPYK